MENGTEAGYKIAMGAAVRMMMRLPNINCISEFACIVSVAGGRFRLRLVYNV
jgi:hypothetical protein